MKTVRQIRGSVTPLFSNGAPVRRVIHLNVKSNRRVGRRLREREEGEKGGIRASKAEETREKTV